MYNMGITHLTQWRNCDNIYIMISIVKDKDWVKRADSIKPDYRRRVNLPKALVSDGVVYHIYSNSVGQIVLDPQVTISASEAWLFNNPKAFASVKRGLADAAQGMVSKIDLESL